MKFGIMGPGRIAHSFCGAVRELADEETGVIAVASRSSRERAERFAGEEQIGLYYGSYEELLQNPEVEAVYISTTHNFHYENIRLCLQAGKHVLCEKPMVLTEKEAEEVIRLAKEKKCFLMEAMWSRFLPKTQKVREWVRKGRIGEVKLAQGTIGFVAPVDADDRFYNPDLAGGVLLDMGIYLIDLLPYFADQEIREVEAMPVFAETGTDAQLNLTLRLTDAVASGQATIQAVVPEDAYLYGSKGFIRIPKIHWGSEAILYDEKQQVVEHFAEPFEYGFKYEIQEMLRCIAEGRLESDIASHEMSLMNCRIFDRLRQQWAQNGF